MNVPPDPSGEVLAILRQIQDKLGPEFEVLAPDELRTIRELQTYAETLIEMARYEQAKGLVWRANKSALLTAAAVISALLTLWAFGNEVFEGLKRAIGL